jgi:hypothetical protein
MVRVIDVCKQKKLKHKNMRSPYGRIFLREQFSPEQFGIDALVPVCRPPASPSEHTPEFKEKLE